MTHDEWTARYQAARMEIKAGSNSRPPRQPPWPDNISHHGWQGLNDQNNSQDTEAVNNWPYGARTKWGLRRRLKKVPAMRAAIANKKRWKDPSPALPRGIGGIHEYEPKWRKDKDIMRRQDRDRAYWEARGIQKRKP